MVNDNTNVKDSRIIVALDYNNQVDALNMAAKLDPSLCKLKIGKELFTACGPQLVEKIIALGFKVFLDLKFHDIPNTVYKACRAASDLGVWMINVHALGGEPMLEMAKRGVIDSGNNTLLIAVTVLTSMSELDLKHIGVERPILEEVLHLAKISYTAGLDGVVCSALEARLIKYATNDNFITVTPGIRLTMDKVDDQTRIMTPTTAIKNGADYLVIGRPILTAADPYGTLLEIAKLLR